MAEKLADRTVVGLRCPEGRRELFVFDAALAGFGVRVPAAGAPVFVFEYKARGPTGWRTRRVTLGAFGTEITTAEARRQAEKLRGLVRNGHDPVAERRAAQAAANVAEVEAQAVAAAAAYTVDVLIGQWEAHHLAERSASYRTRVPREMRTALAEWVAVPAARLSREDAMRVLDAVKADRGPIAANRLHAVARACWGWAVKRGALSLNPWSAVPRPSRELARERVLSGAELGALWRAAADLGEPWPGIIRLMLLTGQRRGEVAGMRWEELDLEAALWSLPGERTKNGRPHTVPLSRSATELLRAVKRRAGAALVFEGARKTVPSGFGKVAAALDAALAKTAKEAGRKAAPWVLHDIRRSVATGLQRLGVRLEVTEALLNRVSGSRSGIVGVYQRHGWEKEKAAAAEAWAAHLMTAVDGTTARSNVVVLQQAG